MSDSLWLRLLFLVVFLFFVCGVFLWLLRRQKFAQAYKVHLEKYDHGVVLIDSKREGWSDGSDVVLHYSDGSRYVIEDTRTIPPWAVSKR